MRTPVDNLQPKLVPIIMKKSLNATLLVLFSLSGAAHAQNSQLPPRQNMLQVLVPVRTGEFPGVAGSRWINELWVHNDNDVEVNIVRLQWVPSPCPPYCGGITAAPLPDKPIPPHSTVSVPPSQPVIYGQVGEFFYIDRALAPAIYFELRTHDESRNSISAGTEIPVVTEATARHKIEFPAVPVSADFRYSLRVYTFGYDSTVSAGNRIRVFDTVTGARLLDEPAQFGGFAVDGPTNYAVAPFPNERPLDLPGNPRLAGVTSVRIEIESGVFTLWAFLSLTNNTSNEVTVVSPWTAR